MLEAESDDVEASHYHIAYVNEDQRNYKDIEGIKYRQWHRGETNYFREVIKSLMVKEL